MITEAPPALKDEGERRMVTRSSVVRDGLDPQLLQLPGIDRGRRVGEQADRPLALGKCDHVAQRGRAGEDHRQAVDAEGDAAVRRRAEAERLEKKAELRL